MRITGDLILRGSHWDELRNNLMEKNGLFTRVVDFFVIAASIGIASDSWMDNDSDDFTLTIARDTYQVNYDLSDLFDFMFKSAILTTNLIDLTSEERMKIAFDDEYNSSKLSPGQMLVKYANYGAKQLLTICSDHDVDTADKLYELVNEYINDNYRDHIDELLPLD